VTGPSPIDIFDAQVHLYAEDSPRHPWDRTLFDDPTRAGMLSRFRSRPWRSHPDRFRVVGLVDADRDDIEDHVASWGRPPETA
jgi:hypothetical protein